MSNLKYNANGEVVGAVQIEGSTIIQPVDIQSRLSTTIQTQNAVSVGISGFALQAGWTDCNGYSDIAVTYINDATTLSTLSVHWSNDGTTQHGDESLLASANNQRRQSATSIKARYARIALGNGDTALPHTMSAWIYLKA